VGCISSLVARVLVTLLHINPSYPHESPRICQLRTCACGTKTRRDGRQDGESPTQPGQIARTKRLKEAPGIAGKPASAATCFAPPVSRHPHWPPSSINPAPLQPSSSTTTTKHRSIQFTNHNNNSARNLKRRSSDQSHQWRVQRRRRGWWR
jgi:hypothetical protein